MKRTFFLLLPLGVLWAPSGLAAQKVNCADYFYDGCWPGEHYTAVTEDGNISGIHAGCALCVLPPCHEGCSQGEEEDRLEDLQAAVRADQHETVLQQFLALAERVELNPVRRSIQVRDCEGPSYIANLPLSQSMFNFLAENQER